MCFFHAINISISKHCLISLHPASVGMCEYTIVRSVSVSCNSICPLFLPAVLLRDFVSVWLILRLLPVEHRSCFFNLLPFVVFYFRIHLEESGASVVSVLFLAVFAFNCDSADDTMSFSRVSTAWLGSADLY